MEIQALQGVKVLDFGWAIAGSLTGKYLGDYGAEVVKVESVNRLDLFRTTRQGRRSKNNPDDRPDFASINTSKYGIRIDLKHPRSREILDRLIRWADIVNENFTPGTMKKLGLDYEHMKIIKPDIIMVSGSLYGQTGPLALEWGVDGTGAALTGHYYLSGWPDRDPISTRLTYGDNLLPLINVTAVIAALDYKRRTGKGQYIDASMLEIWTHKVSPAIMDWESNKHLETRNGNRLTYAAPHGVFPCEGDDRWCAITVFTDEEWQAFCRVLGNPGWTKELEFADLDARKKNEDELETLIAEWTRKRPAEEVMQMMQAAGVPAGVVQDVRDLSEHDPQLKEREFLVPLKHPVLGVLNHARAPFRLLTNKAQVRPAPCLGEHTEYVCTHLLGMSSEEFASLFVDGVFN